MRTPSFSLRLPPSAGSLNVTMDGSGLSQSSLGVIRTNVIFSMSMNVLSVLLSVFGVIGPVVGAVMHEVSALPVVANSARLINWKPRRSKTEEKAA